MKRFTLALAAALALVNFSTAAAPVEVLKAHNYTMSRYGQSTQYLGATVSVDNLAYSKVVEIVYRDSDNQWKTVPATYRHGAGSNKEVWEAGWTRTTAGATQVPALNLEFAVKYQVNGQTYWDNNGGQPGAVLYEDKLPVHPDAKEFAYKLEIDPTACALSGGEDYELIFTLSQADYDKIKDVNGIRVVGYVAEQKEGAHILTRGGNKYALTAQGWNAFGK